MKLEDEIKQREFESEKQKLIVNQLFTGRWVADLIAYHLKPYALTSQQYNVLRILRGQKGDYISVNGISDRMIDKMSNVSRLIEKLNHKGLVFRKINQEDRRRVDIEITEKGLSLLKKLDNMEREVEKKFNKISNAEAKQLNDLMDKLRG